MNAAQEQNWAIACHLSSLIWVPVVLLGFKLIFFMNLFVPAVIWLNNKDHSELIDTHGKESLNFQISMSLVGIGVILAVFVSMLMTRAMGADPMSVVSGLLSGVGLVLSLVFLGTFALFQITMVIFAAVKAKNGEFYRYPFTLRLL